MHGKIFNLMNLGVHISIAGGLPEAPVRAMELACSTMQMFSRSPRGGTPTRLDKQVLLQFDRLRRQAKIDPLVVHGPYIANLASPESYTWKRSVVLLKDEYERCAQLDVQYLVVHVGSHKGSGQIAGVKRVAEAINQILDRRTQPVKILLENSAGSGQGIGNTFEDLAAIRKAVNAKASVGVCLDTAHLFAAGHPIHTKSGLEKVVTSFDKIVGKMHLNLIHLNDSKVPFDSRVDRHWHIGEGHIGLEAFGRIVNHPLLKRLPFILETPKSTIDDDQRNISTVLNLVESKRSSGRSRKIPV